MTAYRERLNAGHYAKPEPKHHEGPAKATKTKATAEKAATKTDSDDNDGA